MGSGSVLCASCFDKFPRERNDADDDDGDDDDAEVLLNNGDVAKVVTAPNKERDPRDAADDVVLEKGGVVHFANACDEGCEGADDGDEACEDDCFFAVLGEKGVGAVKVIFAKEKAVVFGEHCRSELVADEVVEGIAKDCGKDEEQPKEEDVEHAEGCKRACRKEQAVTGQERGDDESGFEKDDEEKQGIGPAADGLNDGCEVFVEVKNDVKGVHGRA